MVAEAVPVEAAAAVTAAQATGRAATGFRRPPPRRTPTLAINYDYLSKDLRTLVGLAVAMVVLLVIAYFIWH
jgi:hypothetical protein